MRMRAVFNGTVVAESDDTVVVEGNHYFPAESLREDLFRPSRTRTLCPWKGLASYYTLDVDGVTLPDAAWFYPRPSPLARRVKGRVAFWPGVEVGPVGEDLEAGSRPAAPAPRRGTAMRSRRTGRWATGWRLPRRP